jgi:hypothetical protein
MVFVIVCIMMLTYMRYRYRLYLVELDEGTLDANDFTVMIRNLPPNSYNENDLK